MTTPLDAVKSENDLVALAVALGAAGAGGPLATCERHLISKVTKAPNAQLVQSAMDAIASGEDPLGDMFSVLRAPHERREKGATYTPRPIVQTMIDWARTTSTPDRVVDPGIGSGRFLCQAAAAFPNADLVGIDIDPIATLMARANLSATGNGHRAKIIVGDFREFSERIEGKTLYIGNPPYVRHHQIPTEWKDWLAVESAKLGLTASKLAGLHIYFFLATALRAKAKDVGAFITAAEWLDVNYGSLLRSLIVGRLGGKAISVIDPTAQPFPDAATTAAITTFEIGTPTSSICFQRVDKLSQLASLGGGRKVSRDRLESEPRWSHLTRVAVKPPEGYVELGELCRVHRGTVTGANGVWIAGTHSVGLPESVLYPTVTRAREVLEAGGLLADSDRLRRVIDIPADLDELDGETKKAVINFLKIAKAMGANNGYVASHRRAWWSVGLRAPAPIISTYMARRPPGFVINEVNARHINIAHGLYPRDHLNSPAKETLVRYLQGNISQRSGRTYAGGLTKFEPREMERLIVPGPEMLSAGVVA